VPLCRVKSVITGASGLPGLGTAYFVPAAAVATTAEATDVAARVRAFWLGVAPNLESGTNVAVSGVVDSLDPATGTLVGQTVGTTPAVVNATGTSASPTATMLGLRLATGAVVNGRLLKGRWFIGPLSSGTNNGGVPLAAALTNLLSGTSGMLTGTTGAYPCVWHRPKLGVGGAAYQVTGYSADTRFWYLRSRRD